MLPDHGPGDLIVALCGGLYGMTCHIIERNHVGQDTHRLIEWTKPENEKLSNSDPYCHMSFNKAVECSSVSISLIPVIRRVSILLQEIIFY